MSEKMSEKTKRAFSMRKDSLRFVEFATNCGVEREEIARIIRTSVTRVDFLRAEILNRNVEIIYK